MDERSAELGALAPTTGEGGVGGSMVAADRVVEVLAG
jgi:hypothetical protein